jgi:predicted small secreted protein
MKYDGSLSTQRSQPFIAQQACLRDRRLSPFATGLKTISGFPQMRRATIAALFMATIVLGGCNTVRGVGDDLKSVANTVDDAT